MDQSLIQLLVFICLTGLIGLATYLVCRRAGRSSEGNQEYFLAGGTLPWYFVAGSITLTNLSTEQLVGMNGSQMALIAWWEFAAVIGLIILAFVFIPVYYKYKCTTTTELLERRYKDKHIRATISLLFLLGNLFIYLPISLYTGSLFMKTMFGVEISIYLIAALFAAVGAAYAILGGLRAVAVSDSFSGILLLGMAVTVVWLALSKIGFDFSGIPAERLTFFGTEGMFGTHHETGAPIETPIPWETLLTGMIFIQMYYWSTNQTITQRAMASRSVKEAQKGVLAAAGIRLLIVPPIVVLPGIVAYKLYGDIGDGAYGQIVADLLPVWLSGAFAAAIAAAVLTTFNSILNSSAALYVCDLHESYIEPNPNVQKLSTAVTLGMVAIGLLMVPVYNQPDSSIIDTIQKLNGLLSMPILATFVVGLLFRNVDARAMILGVASGVSLYAIFTFVWTPTHYIHLMAVTLLTTITAALVFNRLLFGKTPVWDAKSVFGKGEPEPVLAE